MKIVEVTHQGVKMHHYVNEPVKAKGEAAKPENKADAATATVDVPAETK